jgi:hypothetical protein
VKIAARLSGLKERLFEARIAELRARLQSGERGGAALPDFSGRRQEVSDGERELGSAAGDLRRVDR